MKANGLVALARLSALAPAAITCDWALPVKLETNPVPPVVAAVWARPLRPVAMELACACWPAAVLAWASALAAPSSAAVPPRPAFAVAPAMAVPLVPEPTDAAIEVALAAPPTPVLPWPAPPVALAVVETVLEPVRLTSAVPAPPVEPFDPVTPPPAPPVALLVPVSWDACTGLAFLSLNVKLEMAAPPLPPDEALLPPPAPPVAVCRKRRTPPLVAPDTPLVKVADPPAPPRAPL